MMEFETITLAPIDLDLVEPSLLTPRRARLAERLSPRVCETLSPLVDEETRAWLARATRTI